MKLVDILARELKDWPEDGGCGYCVQAFGSRDVIFGGRSNYFEASEVAEDNADARVTRAEWQAAVDALKATKEKVMDIDWSKAPEGATHRVPHGCWYKIEDGLVWCWSSREEWAGPYPKKQYEDGSMEDMVKRPKTASEWNGEGLPPVGTVCEYKHVSEWQKVEVFAVKPNHNGSHTALFTYENGTWCGCAEPSFFRPIRTPEQIAAEERKKTIEDMVRIIQQADWNSDGEMVGALYDAGYRKFEIVEGEEEATHCFGLPISEIRKMAKN